MTKRLNESWYALGKNIEYDFSTITRIRNLIKTLKYNIKYYQNCIYELESCFTYEKELKSLDVKLQWLQNSIDLDKHNEFLNLWRVVGRSGYALNYKAISNCREDINKLVKAEFFKLSNDVRQEILIVKNNIKAQQDRITLSSSQSKPIIIQYQVIIETEEAKIVSLKIEFDTEVIKIKKYLQTF